MATPRIVPRRSLIVPTTPRSSPATSWYLVVGGDLAGGYREAEYVNKACCGIFFTHVPSIPKP